jgi:DNA-binding response OmpR family regulator
MKNILVADDNIEIVESVKKMLKPFYNVDVATTGIEVLDWFEKKDYYGLIIDVDFQHGINGLEIASRLRTRHKKLKILVFSATDYSDRVRQRVIDIGAVFSEKPLGLDFILRVMDDT